MTVRTGSETSLGNLGCVGVVGAIIGMEIFIVVAEGGEIIWIGACGSVALEPIAMGVNGENPISPVRFGYGIFEHVVDAVRVCLL